MRFVLLAFALLLQTSCLSQMKSVDHFLSSDVERRGELSKRVSKYHQAMYWGDVDSASAYLSPETRREIRNSLLDRKEKEHLVKTEVDAVDIHETGDSATVDMKIKYYLIPNYVVKTRREKQVWQFESGAWFLAESTVIKSM